MRGIFHFFKSKWLVLVNSADFIEHLVCALCQILEITRRSQFCWEKWDWRVWSNQRHLEELGFEHSSVSSKASAGSTLARASFFTDLSVPSLGLAWGKFQTQATGSCHTLTSAEIEAPWGKQVTYVQDGPFHVLLLSDHLSDLAEYFLRMISIFILVLAEALLLRDFVMLCVLNMLKCECFVCVSIHYLEFDRGTASCEAECKRYSENLPCWVEPVLR